MAGVTSDRALYGTADGKTTDNPEDAVVVLAARAGKEIPKHLADKYGVADFLAKAGKPKTAEGEGEAKADEGVAPAPEQAKAQPSPEDKTIKGPTSTKQA